MSTDAPPTYLSSLLLAQQADTPEKDHEVLKDVLDRLRSANSAIAVDSAASILEILVKRGPL